MELFSSVAKEAVVILSGAKDLRSKLAHNL